VVTGTKGHARVHADIDPPFCRRVLPGRMDRDSPQGEDIQGGPRFPIFMPDDQFRAVRENRPLEQRSLFVFKEEERIPGFFPKPDIIFINQGGDFSPDISFKLVDIYPIIHGVFLTFLPINVNLIILLS
jgi:hypothetical protein